MVHLRHHDYSEWVRDCIKTPTLAAEIQEIEKNDALGHSKSLTQVQSAVERHDVLSPTSPLFRYYFPLSFHMILKHGNIYIPVP